MADIIALEERIRKQREQALSQKKIKRLNSFWMALQCSGCHLKCPKCGFQLEAPQPQTISEELPVRLCQACWEEYLLYREMTSGRTPVAEQAYYHNQAWLEIWTSWLQYQRSLQGYRNSKEFLRLLEELNRK